MAHVQKFTKGSVGGLSIHIERKTLNHSNKEIDTNRTHLNYDFCNKDGDMNQRLSDRLEEVYCFNRADVKVMADWVVTLPEELKELPSNQQKEFFKETYQFLEKRYGEKNVLSGTVHNDETTPHLHFAFIPVVFDKKNQREKVSAKEVLNRNELKTFHQDLDKYLKEKIPEIYQGGVLNDKTIGIEDVKMLKKHSHKIKELEEKLKQENESLNKELKEIKISNRALVEIEKLKNRSTEKGIINKRIELAPKDFDNLLHSAKENQKLRRLYIQSKKDNQKLKKDNQKLKKEFKVLHNEYQEILDQQEETNQKLENKNAELLNENQSLKNELHEFEIYKEAYTDILFEDYDVSTAWIPFEELHARYILCQIDDFGKEPQSLKEGYEWQSILEKGRETNIEPKRLESAINKVKEFIEKFKEKVIARRKNKEQDMER